MVILRGVVRSGTASTDDADSYIANAAIVQESSAVYTSTNGTFYTSALTLDVATCQATEYASVSYSIPDFATTYDPAGVISGSLTLGVDTSSDPGRTMIWDTDKIFMSGTLTGRILEMRSGIDDSLTAIIDGNTQNSINLGGVSGATLTFTSSTIVPQSMGGNTRVRYSPNGNYVAVSADDVEILKVSGTTYTALVTLTSGSDQWNELCWSPDSTYLAVFKSQGAAPYALFYKRSGDTFTKVATSTSVKVEEGCGFNPVYDEVYEYVGYYSNQIVAYSRSGDTFTMVPGGAGMNSTLSGWGQLFAISPDGEHIAVGDYGTSGAGYASIKIYERIGSLSYTLIQALDFPGAKYDVRYMYGGSYTSDGKYLITTIYGNVSNSIRSFSVTGSNTITEISNACNFVSDTISPKNVSIAPDGKMVVINAEDWGYYYSVNAYTLESGVLTWFDIVPLIGGNPYPIYDVTISPGSDQLYLGGSNNWNCAYEYAFPTSGCVITHAVSGDIYNIGGVSGESTRNIIFTMWDNKAYGRGRGR